VLLLEGCCAGNRNDGINATFLTNDSWKNGEEDERPLAVSRNLLGFGVSFLGI
jgi:hypothetical protein